MSTLNKLGITEEEAEEAISQITIYGEETPKILSEAQTLLRLEKETSIKYPDLASKYQRMNEKIPTLRQEIKERKEEIERLQEDLTNLEALETLQDKLQKHRLTTKKMDQFIENNLKLEEKGFTPSAAETLSTELAKHGLNPKKAAEIVSGAIAEHASLEKAISKAKRELETTERKREEAEHTRRLLQKDARNLEGQIMAMKTISDEYERSIELKKSRASEEVRQHWLAEEKAHAEAWRKKEAELADKLQNLQSDVQTLEERKQTLGEDVERKVRDVEEAPLKRKRQLEGEIRTLEEEKKILEKEVAHLKKEQEHAQKVEETIKKMGKELQNWEAVAKLTALLTRYDASEQRENLEPLIVILKKISSGLGLGGLWYASNREKIKVIEGAIKVLAEEVRRGRRNHSQPDG